LWGVIAFALAILTKGTAFLYGFPLILIFGIILATKIGKKSINLIMLGTVLIAVICGGHYFRNYQTFGHIFGKPDKGYDYNNREYGYKTIISNGLRNMALHFAVSKRVAKGTELVVKKLFDALQIPWNDPKTTWPASKFSLHPELKTHEDYGGNFCHMLLIIVSVITIFYYLITRKGYDYLVLAYLGVLISMFFIFIGYLKWQPWHSRLHLAMFVFSAPVIAYALVKIEWKWIAFGIIGIMFYQSAPYLYNNMTRPLWGKNSVLKKSREINYFNSRKSIGESYLKLVREIHRQKISKLGLICGKNTWEYPIWKLERNINRQFVLMHAAVGDLSKKYADNEGYNSILKITDKNREVERIDNKEYKMIWHNGKCALYKMKLIL